MAALIFSSLPEFEGSRVACEGVITGEAFNEFHEVDYLIEADENGTARAYRIRYAMRCSPFREAMRIGDVLAVGHEGHVYLFDTVMMRNLLVLPMTGYFGHLYLEGGLFYVASSSDLHCIDPTGRIQWRSPMLGIDGVEVDRFEADHIHGAGEWDPPGGWRRFVLDRRTGAILKSHQED